MKTLKSMKSYKTIINRKTKKSDKILLMAISGPIQRKKHNKILQNYSHQNVRWPAAKNMKITKYYKIMPITITDHTMKNMTTTKSYKILLNDHVKSPATKNTKIKYFTKLC